MQIAVAGEPVTLLADRGVLWAPGGVGTALVADVHFGKTDTFRHFGLPVPDVDLDADLLRLTSLVRETSAARLLILGDLVHASAGLNDAVVERVARWRAALDVDVELVLGNHDRAGIPAAWRIHARAEGHAEGPFRFTHHPVPSPDCYTWCGHLHPAVVLGRGRLAERFPCFWLGSRVGVLPAYGGFTGGRAVRPEPGDRRIAVTAEGLVEV